MEKGGPLLCEERKTWNKLDVPLILLTVYTGPNTVPVDRLT